MEPRPEVSAVDGEAQVVSCKAGGMFGFLCLLFWFYYLSGLLKNVSPHLFLWAHYFLLQKNYWFLELSWPSHANSNEDQLAIQPLGCNAFSQLSPLTPGVGEDDSLPKFKGYFPNTTIIIELIPL